MLFRISLFWITAVVLVVVTPVCTFGQTPPHPASGRPTVATADRYFAQFKYEDAIEVYRNLLSSDSTDYWTLTRLTESWNLHGLDLQAAGEKDEAELAFEHAVLFAEQTYRHHPDSARTYVNLAAAYGNLALFRGGKTKVHIGRQVEEYTEKALDIDSTDVIALAIMGVFHREVSKLGWLERLLAKAIYGGIPKGSLEKSANYLERAADLDSTAVFPNYSLAVTYRRMHEMESARNQYQRVGKLEPANSEEARYVQNAIAWLQENESNSKKR
jgi:tetratricopeptide (TPR) repeat protein